MGSLTLARPTLGIIGGMGPMATVDFIRKVISLTPAASDQDHIPLLVAADPTTPDRSEAILGEGPSPLPHLLAAARLLDSAGAALIAIACNTAHHWHADLQGATKAPIVSIVDAALAEVRRLSLKRGAVGILATTGSLRAGIFQKPFAAAGMTLLEPAEHDQQALMSFIRAVKAGAPGTAPRIVIEVAERLRRRGAEAILLACTEIPLGLGVHDERLFVDATGALARECVRGILSQPVRA